MPQIEIMMSDLPHTLYRPVKKPGATFSKSDIDEAVKLNAELRKRKKAVRQKERGYTVEEIFNGDADEN